MTANSPTVLFIAAALLFPGGMMAQAQNSDSRDARLINVSGEVTFFPAGGEGPDAEGVPADKDMPLQQGDRITTGPDGGADVGMEGGHIIHMGSRSDLTLERQILIGGD